MANKIYLLRGNDTPLSVCLRKREGDGDPVPYDLSEAERIRLALVGHGMHVFAKDTEVSGTDSNIVSGVIPGRSLLPGDYDLEVTFRSGGRDKRFAVEDMFEAVDFLAEDADGETEGEGAGIWVNVTVQPEVIEIAGPKGDTPVLTADEDGTIYADGVLLTEVVKDVTEAVESAERSRVTAESQRVAAESARVSAENSRVSAENERAAAERSRVSAETARATRAANDHSRAETDHTRAETDHTTAASDHTTAAADHETAGSDHTQAVSDHATAESDHQVMAGYDSRLTNAETEVSQLQQNKADYDIEDVTDTENIRNNTWMKYDNGVAQSASPVGQWVVRYYSCANIKRLYCKVGSDGTLPVSIAFYSQKPIFNNSDKDYYLQAVSVQAQAGIKEYFIDIPQGAAWVVISNRGATFDSPIVKLYSQNGILNAISEYDSELLYQSANTVSSSGINNSFNISTIEDNTQLELEVTEISGDSVLTIELRTGNTKTIYKRYDGKVGKYYFEKTPNLTHVRLDKAAAEGNLYNWKLRTLTKKYPIQYRTFAPFLPAKQVDTIDLGTPFSGYYGYTDNQDAENTRVSASYWVSWPLQKTTGFTIKIEFDATQYVVNFSSFNETYQRRVENNLTTSPVEIDLSSCRGWNLAVRKTNYAFITPSDMFGVVTVTKVSGTIYEKPLLKYEVEKIVNEKVGDANKALTLSKEGYGLNPFIEKPFYYHFRANDFITDAQGHRAIASQSLDDVELAARLGFALIEANIQPTSDGHFVVIHGTSGTFGPECKSINPDIISTADLQATAINSVTLDWIKTNVKYDSYYEKYQTTIPSLEEFCESCKNHNIGIFAGTSNKAAIDICVKYLGQNVFIYNSPTDVRSYFNGWCFIWNNASATTVEQILAACRTKGAPVMYGLGPNLAAQLYADDNMNTLIESMHQEGFLIGWTANYDSEANGRKYHKLGMDFSSSENDINPFEANYEVFDIDSDNLPTTTGSITDGILSLANGQTITCGNTAKIIGKAWLSVRFNGTLTFNFGSRGSSGRTITSDGSEDIVITDYFFMRGSTLTVTSGADTTITKFLYKTSKC